MAERVIKEINRLNNAEQALIIEALSQDKNSNYTDLELYLKQILGGRKVTFKTRSDADFAVPPDEAWRVISLWGQQESTNLPVGDRRSMKNGASSLLEYLKIDIQGKSAEAGASYHLMLEQAKKPLISPEENVSDPSARAYQKAMILYNKQLEIFHNNLIGKITTNLEKTKFLASLPDAESRALALQMMAASSPNFRKASDFSPEKINQLLLHLPGYKQLNNASHLAYSESSKEDVREAIEAINSTISQVYKGNEAQYISDMADLRALVSVSPDLGDIDWMVDRIVHSSTPAEKSRLISAIRSEIVGSARKKHLSGQEILENSLKNSGLNEASLAGLLPLATTLESIEIKERHLLLGGDLLDKDHRILSTAGLARRIGVKLDTPWINGSDLTSVTSFINQKYGTTNLSDAIARANSPTELLVIKDLISKTNEYNRYHGYLAQHPGLAIIDIVARGQGRFSASAEPLARLTRKIWAGYDKIDNIVNKPFNTVVEGWNKLEEKYPLLNPVNYAFTRWTSFQTGIALKVHSWALSISTSGGWFSGFAGHIADFTEGFTKHNADWGGATHFFFERKWGNILDWGSKKITGKAFGVVKKEFWDSVGKTAASVGNKIAAGFGDKVASLIGTATSEAGIGLIILGAQVLWDLTKKAGNKLKEFLGSVWNGDTSNLFGTIPLLLGSVFLAINTALAGIPIALKLAWEVLVSLLKTVWDSLVAIFVLAATIAIIVVATFALLFYGVKYSSETDSNSGNAPTSVVGVQCVQGGGGATGGSPAASQAVCIANFLSQCHLNPLTSSLVNGNAWKCLVAALTSSAQAVSALAASAIHNTYLQCVGFVDAVALAAYNTSIAPKNACSYVNGAPPGFTYHGGTSGMQSGDFFVIGSSDCKDASPGHIGVVLSVGGAIVNVADANYGTGSGGSRANGQFATSQITGYLRKK